MLEGRVQKLIITPVIGVYDGNRLVGEVNGNQMVLYAGQKPEFTLQEMMTDTITDQAVLKKVKLACLLQRGRTPSQEKKKYAKK